MLYPSILVVVYPSTSFSVTVYVISVPFSYFGKSVNVYVHFPSLFALTAVTSCDFTLFPFANRFTVIFSGPFPSWLSASSHVFVPLTVTFGFTGTGVDGTSSLPVAFAAFFISVLFSISFAVTVYVTVYGLWSFGARLDIVSIGVPAFIVVLS